MKNKTFNPTELSDSLRLVEIIPIDNGKLIKSINTKISLKDESNIDNRTFRDLFGGGTRRTLPLTARKRKKTQSAFEMLFDL
ncbi:MAG: hypothetical protein M3261_01365 [Thermoproteota archaeon]|nr:hypothetical protein [Thermoproteota archaeon]